MYDQQAQFYIYEAEEVSSIIKNEDKIEIVQERLNILSKYLEATIIVYDNRKNISMIGHPFNQNIESNILKRKFLTTLWNGENIIFSGNINHQPPEVFLAGVPIKQDNRVIGAVVIYSPITPLKEHVNSISEIAIWTALLGILLVTIISIFIIQFLTKPLRIMENAAYSIAKGDYGKQVPIKSNDEVGRLAKSLNHMSLQLKDKIETLQRLDKSRKEFVSNVSHELRIPLTVIQSFSEAILDGLVKTGEERNDYLTNILNESKRLKRLVNDLLDLGTLEAGNFFAPNERESVYISKLVHFTVNNFKSLAKEKTIDLKVIPHTKEITTCGYVDRLKQVMTNLVGNAIAYTPIDGTIQIKWGEAREDRVFISITDNGSGIPKAELKKIWERFYKVDKSRSRSEQGSGLGLAIAKKIVELHGGEITVESIPGEGSTFTVFLPNTTKC